MPAVALPDVATGHLDGPMAGLAHNIPFLYAGGGEAGATEQPLTPHWYSLGRLLFLSGHCQPYRRLNDRAGLPTEALPDDEHAEAGDNHA